jgi:Flp pilus assembly protein TadG
MNPKHTSERGQAIVLLVLGIVAILGLAALSIDGGRVYTERRQLQNAADAAALAGALQKANGQPDAVAIQAIQVSANANGYLPSAIQSTISWHPNVVGGSYFLVTVDMTSSVDLTLARLFYTGELKQSVLAEARVRSSQPAMAGFAVTTLYNCSSGSGGNSNNIDVNGGGYNGGLETFLGGIFVNSTGTSCCGIDPGNSAGAIGVHAYNGFPISNVGTCDYATYGGLMSPLPVETGFNSGLPITDPLPELPEPQCTRQGYIDANGVYQPGNWDGRDMGTGSYAPGIYCVTHELKLAGQDAMQGDGVVIYLIDSPLTFVGNASLSLSAPNSANCLGTEGDPTASCTYKGIVIFGSRTNTEHIGIRGNGGIAVSGMIYAISATVDAYGGGYDPDDTEMVGQVVCSTVELHGNGSMKVTYDPMQTYILPPQISLER